MFIAFYRNNKALAAFPAFIRNVIFHVIRL